MSGANTLTVVQQVNYLTVQSSGIQLQIGGAPVGAVLYNVPQALGAPQQAQARTNIGATDAYIAGLSPVQSVAGKTGVVVLTSADVGLGNVNNTSDANKPVSTAQAAALLAKAGDTMTGSLLASGGAADLGSAAAKWRDLNLSRRLNGSAYSVVSDIGLRVDNAAGTTSWAEISASGLLLDSAAGVVAWGNVASFTKDTGLSRGAAGQVNVGNGTAGDASGTVRAASLNASGAVFTAGGFSCGVGAAAASTAIGQVAVLDQSVQRIALAALAGGSQINLASSTTIAWSSTDNSQGVRDTGFSRSSAGVAALGTGAQGSAGGTLKLALIACGPFTVATLPSAAASPVGAKTAVSDCANPTSVGSAVTGGGSSMKGVINTGSVWNVD